MLGYVLARLSNSSDSLTVRFNVGARDSTQLRRKAKALITGSLVCNVTKECLHLNGYRLESYTVVTGATLNSAPFLSYHHWKAYDKINFVPVKRAKV